jgi:hypothetical protein
VENHLLRQEFVKSMKKMAISVEFVLVTTHP